MHWEAKKFLVKKKWIVQSFKNSATLGTAGDNDQFLLSGSIPLPCNQFQVITGEYWVKASARGDFFLRKLTFFLFYFESQNSSYNQA